MNEVKWSENIILVDAEYVDKVAFDLIVNFERMLGRRIPQADMARWIDCVALDGGLRDGEHETHVVLIHDKVRTRLDNFAPASFEEELNGKAFRDNLGEFVITALPVEALTTKGDFFLETLQLACEQKEVKRIMVIPSDDEKRITLFNMRPREGGNFRQEILGYSLMSALGISGKEIEEKM